MTLRHKQYVVLLILLHVSVVSCQNTAKKDPTFKLRLIRTLTLGKTQGEVDELIELPNGGFLVRDSASNSPESQAVEVYNSTGAFSTKIGSYGYDPGHYRALKGISFTRINSLVWVLDAMGRVSRFDLGGHLVNSVLVQKPGFHPYSIALDEKNGKYYLSGCVALHFYLDLGCQMVHEYNLNTSAHVASFANNDPAAVAMKYFSVEDYKVAVAPDALYAIDAPMRKLWKIQEDSKITSFPIVSNTIKVIPILDPTRAKGEIAKGEWLYDNLIVTKKLIVVSASLKGDRQHLLEVLTHEGKTIATDVVSPGRLIGGSGHETLWFGHRNGSAFELDEYSF